SEMKAIFASGLVEPKLDVAGLDPFIDRGADPRFPFEGIEHVPPASYVSVDLDKLESTISSYWSAGTADNADLTEEGAIEAASVVLEQLEEAVRLRLRADVP